MEITMKDFKELIGETSTGQSTIYGDLISTRVLIRTRVSGVSVGVLREVQESAAGFAVKLDDGLRIWSWKGALACSELARLGPDESKTEVHQDGVIIADEGIELHSVTAEAWERMTQ